MNRQLTYLLACVVLTVSCIPARPTGNTGRDKRAISPSLLELPAVRQGEVITTHAGYATCFNSSLMLPNWVAYELTEEETRGTVPRPSNSPFQQDPAYKGKQPDRKDYSRSGWDKGHLMPCADSKWSEQVMLESFYFTNICPQNHDFNEKDWQKLEDKGRTIARKKGSVFIVCGPIVTVNEFGKLGENQVVIPDYYFKAFLYRDEGGFHSIAYIMPNKYTGRPVNEFAVSVNELEKLLGIDLFTRLNDKIEEGIESQLILEDWN